MKPYLHNELNDSTSFRGKLIHSLREIVFGLEDGIVSTLGAITGIAAATQDLFVVVLSGVVIIFVESLSMGAGTFLSSKSEREVEEHMLREEAEEIELHPEAEKKELEIFYSERGFTPKEIQMLIHRITSNKELWLEEMAYRELGIIPNRKDNIKLDALFMWMSYILGGAVPIASYFIFPIAQAIPVSIVSSIIGLFIVGAIKGRVVRTSKLKSGLEMVLVSLGAAAVGYIAGQIVNSVFGVAV